MCQLVAGLTECMIGRWTRSQAEKKVFRWVVALDYRLDTPFEIILVTPTSGNGLTELLAPLRHHFVPNRLIAIAQEGDDVLEKSANLPIIKYRKVSGGTATAYVC